MSLICFSGAAPVKVRKGSKLQVRIEQVAPSFSGAAPVKVRKVRLPSIQQTTSPSQLQWGRTREGAEGNYRSLQSLGIPFASVGPHP